jgi:FtsP/CotA-like multicopper oxidase with cupredoxin domain
VAGQQIVRQLQIASEGGLLPVPILRDSIEIWPAKRREVIVDFSQFATGTVMYLTNTMQMLDGRKPSGKGDPGFINNFAVPLMKIVVDGLPPEPDLSLMPVANRTPLRAAPPNPGPTAIPQRTFTLMRGSPANLTPGETEWIINGLQFDPLNPLALPVVNTFETWAINNGGGGWVHPMHLHQEEHHVLTRDRKPTPDARHPDDTGKEDVVALDPSESTTIFRGFRTYNGNYVAHCHNLAHEDHNMMFGWTIVK